MIAPTAGVLLWLGATLIVVGDGRRGLAAGIGLSALGLAILAFLVGGAAPAAALALGGGIAATRRYVSGPSGWAILPPGSTPRLVLCIAAALVAFWVAAGITSGPYASLRFATLLGAALAAARALITTEESALLTALVLLALSVASGSGVGSSQPELAPYIAGGALAALAGWLPVPRSKARGSRAT